jgi:sugar phosphate isomerase/epimerase
VYAGVDLTSVYDSIEALADRAELVSLKAHYVAQDGAIGPVDLKRALGILADHGYTGPLSLEYEGNGGDPWAKSAAILDLARSVLGKEGI